MGPQAVRQDIVVYFFFLNGFPELTDLFFIGGSCQPFIEFDQFQAQLPHFAGSHLADKVHSGSPLCLLQ